MKQEWRCACGKLLGIQDGDRLHIRANRGHEYRVGLPVTTECMRCKTLNDLSSPTVEVEAQL